MPKTKVLFVCSGNSVRSLMAEAILRNQAGDLFDVYSAGLEANGVNPLTLQVLEEVGIDTEGLRSKSLAEYIDKEQFGYLITVCSVADIRCPIFTGQGMRLNWPFADPTYIDGTKDEKLAAFRKTRDEIEETIDWWLSCQGIELNYQYRLDDAEVR